MTRVRTTAVGAAPPPPPAKPDPPAAPAVDALEAGSARAYSGERLADPAPPFAVSSTFDEADEQRLIANGPALVAYGAYDALRRPVVLVHGMDGSPRDLLAIADRLRSEGRQVLLFCYDDLRTPAAQSGEALARALERLRSASPATSRLDIVAHSFGGIVTRAALSSLANPSWLTPQDTTPNPRAGFESIRVRTLDTPWQGGGSPPDIPILGQLIALLTHFIFWLIGREAMWEMRSSSNTLAHLHDTALAGVELQNIAAQQVQNRDRIASLDDFSDDARLSIVRFIASGRLPEDTQARLWCRMLSQDSRYQTLRTAVLAAIAQGEITLDDGAHTRALLSISDRIMPPEAGSHTSILRAGEPLLDRLAAELL